MTKTQVEYDLLEKVGKFGYKLYDVADDIHDVDLLPRQKSMECVDADKMNESLELQRSMFVHRIVGWLSELPAYSRPCGDDNSLLFEETNNNLLRDVMGLLGDFNGFVVDNLDDTEDNRKYVSKVLSVFEDLFKVLDNNQLLLLKALQNKWTTK